MTGMMSADRISMGQVFVTNPRWPICRAIWTSLSVVTDPRRYRPGVVVICSRRCDVSTISCVASRESQARHGRHRGPTQGLQGSRRARCRRRLWHWALLARYLRQCPVDALKIDRSLRAVRRCRSLRRECDRKGRTPSRRELRCNCRTRHEQRWYSGHRIWSDSLVVTSLLEWLATMGFAWGCRLAGHRHERRSGSSTSSYACRECKILALAMNWMSLGSKSISK